MAVPPVQRYQSDVWEFLECVDAEEKVWCLLCNPPKAPSYTEALQTCVPPYPLKYNSNNKKQASLMFSVPAKRIFSKDGLTLTRTFSYLNPNAVDAYYVHLSLSSILLCTCRIAIAVPFLCLSKKKKKKTE